MNQDADIKFDFATIGSRDEPGEAWTGLARRGDDVVMNCGHIHNNTQAAALACVRIKWYAATHPEGLK